MGICASGDATVGGKDMKKPKKDSKTKGKAVKAVGIDSKTKGKNATAKDKKDPKKDKAKKDKKEKKEKKENPKKGKKVDKKIVKKEGKKEEKKAKPKNEGKDKKENVKKEKPKIEKKEKAKKEEKKEKKEEKKVKEKPKKEKKEKKEKKVKEKPKKEKKEKKEKSKKEQKEEKEKAKTEEKKEEKESKPDEIVEKKEEEKNDGLEELEGEGEEEEEAGEEVIKLSKDEAALVIQKRFRGLKSRKKYNRMLICYSCGAKVSIKGYSKHTIPCVKETRKEVKVIPKVIRPSKPKKPNCPCPNITASQQEIHDYNEAAWSSYRQARPRCPTCKQKKHVDGFMEHLRACMDKDGNSFDERKYSSKLIQSKVRSCKFRRMLGCYCCGQEFSYKSLPIHHKACPEKRENEMKCLPPEYVPPAPSPPEMEIPGPKSKKREYAKYNKLARDIYKESMAKCKCGRRFFPDRLVKHMSHCKE